MRKVRGSIALNGEADRLAVINPFVMRLYGDKPDGNIPSESVLTGCCYIFRIGFIQNFQRESPSRM
jgi:hypothetical protein